MIYGIDFVEQVQMSNLLKNQNKLFQIKQKLIEFME